MPESFWAQDPLILIHPKYLHRFFPSDKLHTAARMNAVVRCSIYIAIILTIFRKEIVWLIIPVITAGITSSWMYKENPELFKDDLFNKQNINEQNEININPSKERKDPDIQYLAYEIINEDIHKYPERALKYKKREKEKQNRRNTIADKRLFQDMDTSIQQHQKERAEIIGSVAGGIPDAPNFGRKMIEMDMRNRGH